MARAAGVHPSTVSRVLNARGPLSIRPQTRRRILSAAKRLGYRPSALARGLRLQRTQTLGMLVPDITNPFFSAIIKGAADAAHGRGYDLVLCNSEDVPEREAAYLRVLRQRQVDGVLIASSRMADATITALRRDGFPFVLVNRSARGAEDLAVVVDNRAAAEGVIGYLASLGHRRIGHIAGPPTTTTGAERAEGVRAATRRLQLDRDRALVVEAEAFSEEAGYRAARALLRLAPPPSAIFGANDLIALGALRAAREAGLRVPEELSLVGFNDIPLAELLQPALTTVHVPQLEMGAEAARLLIERLEGTSQPTGVILPTTLVARASCAAPSAAARRIA